MNRNKIILIIVLLALVVLLFYFLPGAPERQGSVQSICFNRTAKLVSPPAQLLRKGTGSMVYRFLDRLEWGTTHAVNRAIGALAATGNPVVTEEAIRRIELFRRDRPSLAKVYIDLLAEIGSPEALPVLLACSSDPTEMVRLAALRGLSSHVSQDSTATLIEQALGGSQKVREVCLESLAARSEPEVLALYRDLIEEDRDLRVTTIAVEGLGSFDTPEARDLLARCREDDRLDVRTAALKALLRLGDAAANGTLEEMLKHEGPIRRINGIKLLMGSRWLPPIDLLQKLATDPVYDARVFLTVALSIHAAQDRGEQKQRAQAGLETLMADERRQVSMKAIEGLYKAGSKGVALSFLRKLPEARGAELSEAIEITTALLGCPEATDLLEKRFLGDDRLDADERLAILNGLSEVGDMDSARIFFRVINGEWNARNLKIGEFTLDRLAAFRVHAFGEEVLELWYETLDDDGTDRAAYLFVNGTRNLGSPTAADRLLAIAGDAARPRWLREEAVKSFVYLEDVSLGDRLLAFQRDCPDRETGALALKVYWNYF